MAAAEATNGGVGELLQQVAPLLLFVTAIIAAIPKYLEVRHNPRTYLKDELEIYEKLPESSKSRARLMNHIEWRIDQITITERLASRDTAGLQATGFLLIVTVAQLPFVLRGGWWSILWITVVTSSVFTVVGLAVSWPKKTTEERTAASEKTAARTAKRKQDRAAKRSS